MKQKRLVVTGLVVVAAFVATAASAAPGPSSGSRLRGRIGPAYYLTGNGRRLRPAGQMTQVGDFPTGGALTNDGRFYWAGDSGHGKDDVRVVRLATGGVVQTLPLPGAYGGITFSPDGRTAYVAGEPRGSSTPSGPTLGDNGDVIHVFSVDAHTGRGREQGPITLPPTSSGYAQRVEGARLGWPLGLSVTRDGRRLLVAMSQADALAIVDLASPAHPVRLVPVGRFAYDVAADPTGPPLAYVSSELDGTVSVVDLDAGTVLTTIGVGGRRGDLEAHAEGLLADPLRHRLYVAVTSRDDIAVIDTRTRKVIRLISVARKGTLGTAPLDLAESPDGSTLYAADSGEDAVAAIALTPRPRGRSGGRTIQRFDVIGRLPTAAYPSAVAVTPDGRHLVWLAAKGLGAGPNPEYGSPFANSNVAPYGSYVPDKLLGYVGVLRRPTDQQMRALTELANRQVRPVNARPAPLATPVQGPNGGPSTQIKHVFYVVRENRTYDQVFGSERRGDGDPNLEVVDDNGRPGRAAGITPNAHALARQFPLLDHFYADSEVSTDGHTITAGSYAIDFVQKALHADYSSRGHVNNAGQLPETYPPNAYVFDQAVRQNVSFRNFGELSAGLLNDGRPTYPAVIASSEFGWPFHFGCDGTYPRLACSSDSGHPGLVGTPSSSRYDYFQSKFDQWVAGGQDKAPSFVYLTLPNDHTNGASPGKFTPQALIADNDLGLGQIVQLISHSSIWRTSAIFVEEDDSQDGADHVDAHRMPAFVISPYARHGAVIHTRYDQYSVMRTVELMLGLLPLSLNDRLATPMYDAFTTKPDLTPYSAITPDQPLDQRNPLTPAVASLSDNPARKLAVAAQELAVKMPFDKVDLVPQAISDTVLWHSVYGWSSTPPAPGPGASPTEELRSRVALQAYGRHQNVGSALRRLSLGGSDDG